jgi:hypothetical protein
MKSTKKGSDQGTSQSVFDTVAQGGGTQQQQDFVQQFQDSAQTPSGQNYMDAVQADIDQGASSSDIEKIIQGMGVKTGTKDKDDMSQGNLQFANFAKNILTSDDPKQALLESDRYKEIKKIMDNYTPLELELKGFGLSSIFDALKQGQTFKKKKDRLKRLDEDGKPIDDELTLEGTMEEIGKLKGGRDDFFNLIKRLDPENFYKVTGMPQTSGGLEDLAGIDATKFGSRTLPDGSVNPNYNPDFANKIFEARQTLDREKGDKPQQGGGGVAPPVTTPDTTPDPADDAYKFNVGGTMPYKDDVYTGGQEMDVPVGRRFALDKTGQLQTSSPTPEDMMQYATTGAYSQLEPFSNYIKRRRKFLGEEEPEYFDEEGNIIYSGVA